MRNIVRALRRTPEAAPDVADDVPGPPEPGPREGVPPEGVPLATYADIVTGGDLSVATEERGRLALREVDGDALIPLDAEVLGEGTRRVVHADLSGVELPEGTEERLFDVVVIDDGSEPEQVWVPPTVADSPTIPPPTADGTRRFIVGRGIFGFLKVRVRREPRGVEVLAFAAGGDSVDLTLPSSTTGRLALVSDDEVLAAFPIDTTGDLDLASITLERLPSAGTDGFVDLVVDSGGERLPVVRRANGLESPGGAVVLPDLRDERSGSRLRLRFDRSGRLKARVFAAGAPEADGDETE